jgi:hypothetical protein
MAFLKTTTFDSSPFPGPMADEVSSFHHAGYYDPPTPEQPRKENSRKMLQVISADLIEEYVCGVLLEII